MRHGAWPRLAAAGPRLCQRLVGALEFNANILLGTPSVPYVCHGNVTNARVPTLVVAYNAMHNRLNYSLPITNAYISQVWSFVGGCCLRLCV